MAPFNFPYLPKWCIASAMRPTGTEFGHLFDLDSALLGLAMTASN
jgi:hypothetical protein